MSDLVDEGKPEEEIQPDESGRFPESIPWAKYVGIKEAWGKTKEKVASLEEKLKSTISAEEHAKVKSELEEVKTKAQQTAGELKSVRDKSLSEKRDILKNRGVSEEDIKDASEKELNILIKALGEAKPRPDLGQGGGKAELIGSPMELAVRAYSKK